MEYIIIHVKLNTFIYLIITREINILKNITIDCGNILTWKNC